MHFLDPPWIGRLIAIGVLSLIAAMLYVGHWLEKKGITKNYSRGLGRGLLEVDSMLRPSKAYVREAKEKQSKAEDDSADSGDPDSDAGK